MKKSYHNNDGSKHRGAAKPRSQEKTIRQLPYVEDARVSVGELHIGHPVVVFTTSFTDPIFGFIRKITPGVEQGYYSVVVGVMRWESDKYVEKGFVFYVQSDGRGKVCWILPLVVYGKETIPTAMMLAFETQPEEIALAYLTPERYRNFVTKELPELSKFHPAKNADQLEEFLTKSGFMGSLDNWLKEKHG